jgi:FMN phosphatase YigB (HAD superfamily)
VFTPALAALGSSPERTLHVGDEDIDAEGAAAAGLRYRPAPLAAVAAELLA